MMEIKYTTITKVLCQPVADLLKVCFPDMRQHDQYTAEELVEMAERFSEGTIVALDGEKVVGMGTGVFMNLDFYNLPPTENDLLYPNDEFRHNVNGAYYYGSDMAVHPAYRGRGIGREIYGQRKALVRRYNRKGFAAAAVLPGYASHKATLDIHQYVDKVVAGELFDPTLSVQLRNGFQVVRLVQNFFTFPRSDNWAALILWENPSHQE